MNILLLFSVMGMIDPSRFQKTEKAHKEIIVGLVLGVAIPEINSCPHNIELSLSPNPSVLELKTCNSEDEFWVETLKDKKASQTLKK